MLLAAFRRQVYLLWQSKFPGNTSRSSSLRSNCTAALLRNNQDATVSLAATRTTSFTAKSEITWRMMRLGEKWMGLLITRDILNVSLFVSTFRLFFCSSFSWLFNRWATFSNADDWWIMKVTKALVLCGVYIALKVLGPRNVYFPGVRYNHIPGDTRLASQSLPVSTSWLAAGDPAPTALSTSHQMLLKPSPGCERKEAEGWCWAICCFVCAFMSDMTLWGNDF